MRPRRSLNIQAFQQCHGAHNSQFPVNPLPLLANHAINTTQKSINNLDQDIESVPNLKEAYEEAHATHSKLRDYVEEMPMATNAVLYPSHRFVVWYQIEFASCNHG